MLLRRGGGCKACSGHDTVLPRLLEKVLPDTTTGVQALFFERQRLPRKRSNGPSLKPLGAPLLFCTVLPVDRIGLD